MAIPQKTASSQATDIDRVALDFLDCLLASSLKNMASWCLGLKMLSRPTWQLRWTLNRLRRFTHVFPIVLDPTNKKALRVQIVNVRTKIVLFSMEYEATWFSMVQLSKITHLTHQGVLSVLATKYLSVLDDKQNHAYAGSASWRCCFTWRCNTWGDELFRGWTHVHPNPIPLYSTFI
jgi:hypothetical protein